MLRHPVPRAALIALTIVLMQGTSPAAGPGEIVVLDSASFWRAYFTLRPPVVRKGDALQTLKTICNTPFPPANWTARDFDDRNWPRLPGVNRRHIRNPWATVAKMSVADLGREYIPPCLARIAMRGTFHVEGPAEVKTLKLTVRYRGGAVVYVNGKEIARGNLPAEGEITPGTPAEDYPREVYERASGSLLGAMCPYTKKDRDAGNVKRWMDRIRTLKDVGIPAGALVKGTNVLAIEIVRPPYHEVLYQKTRGIDEYAMAGRIWGACAFFGAELRAGKDDGVTANTRRPKGFQVWNADVLVPDFTTDYGDPNEPLRPIRIVGAPGGVFSGKVLTGCRMPIRNLRAAMGPLMHVDGVATIPRSSILVRYALSPDLDALTRTPPVEVVEQRIPNRYARKGESKFISFGAVQPVWITVDVPRDARPGDYRGTLTITARGQAPVEVPVELTVCDWTVPPAMEFRTVIDFLQSPESVALHYDVPIYGDRHFKLLEESFKRLGEIGNRSVYIPLVCHSNMGNEQTMVRWVPRGDGSYDLDFTVMERYLDIATRHMGNPRIVCLFMWDQFLGGGNRRRQPGEPVPVSGLDPKTGKVTTIELPRYGTPENRELWGMLAKQLLARLKKRGLEDAVMLGLVPDTQPSREVVKLFGELFPDVPWMRHAHGSVKSLRGAPVRYECLVWTPTFAKDPSIERTYGWKNPRNPTHFCRTRRVYPFRISRLLAEMNIMGHQRGFGRVGLDFWPVLKNKRGERVGDLLARYPKSTWSNIDGVTRAFVPPGPNGAMPTARMLMIREGLQECEARISIETALTDQALRAKLGEDLAARCQEMLDERTRRILMALDNHYFCGFGRSSTELANSWRRWWNKHGHITGYLAYIGSGWQDRSRRLYGAAGEVARALKR